MDHMFINGSNMNRKKHLREINRLVKSKKKATVLHSASNGDMNKMTHLVFDYIDSSIHVITTTDGAWKCDKIITSAKLIT